MTRLIRQLLPFASLLLILVLLSIESPHQFLTAANFSNVFRRCSVNGIIAAGATLVIVSGGIDLSVGAMLALAGMTGACVMRRLGGDSMTTSAMWIGTGVGIAVGTICGLANGLFITRLKLPPFIVTLGTMSIFRGIAYVMNDSQPYNIPAYSYLGNAEPFGIPVSVILAAALMLLAALMLRYTALGRYTYAIGSNREAAFHAGVKVNRNLTAIYTLAGLLAGVGAMIAASRTVSAQPTAGLSLELDIIAAVVIGGASLSGRRGTITGTIVGTLLIGFLRNGCTLLRISDHVQLIVIGLIIILAVAVDQMARAKASPK